MSHHLPRGTGSTFVLLLVLVTESCGGDGGGGEVPVVEGAYTLTYNRVSTSCTGNIDPTWVQGILTVDQAGAAIAFDFGGTYQVAGTVDVEGGFVFDGNLTDADQLVHVTGLGVFSTTDVQSDVDDGILADYDTDSDGTADCRVHGKFSGAKTIGTSGA